MHDLTITTKNETTLVETSMNSYIYTCPICDKQQRFAEPYGKEVVFCDGNDMGTKVFVANMFIECSQANFILQTFTTDQNTEYDPYDLLSVGLLEVSEYTKIENEQEITVNGFKLSELGIQVMQELNNG